MLKNTIVLTFWGNLAPFERITMLYNIIDINLDFFDST